MRRIAIFVSSITVSILVCATASLAANCPSGCPDDTVWGCDGEFTWSEPDDATGYVNCANVSRDVHGSVFRYGSKMYAMSTDYGNGGVFGCGFDHNKKALLNSYTGRAYGYGDTANSGDMWGVFKYSGCKAYWRK